MDGQEEDKAMEQRASRRMRQNPDSGREPKGFDGLPYKKHATGLVAGQPRRELMVKEFGPDLVRVERAGDLQVALQQKQSLLDAGWNQVQADELGWLLVRPFIHSRNFEDEIDEGPRI